VRRAGGTGLSPADTAGRRQPELERFYELVESVKDTEQTLAVFWRR